MYDEDFFKNLHHVLLEVAHHVVLILYYIFLCIPLKIHVEEGSMICPNCEHVYPISNGIPNMV